MKKITKKAIEEFVKQANDVYFTFYFSDETRTQTGELYEAVNMLLHIDRLWYDLAANLDCWYEGNNIICEAIGETVMYWDTDIVDQLSFIDDLEKLALNFYEKNKCTKAK